MRISSELTDTIEFADGILDFAEVEADADQVGGGHSRAGLFVHDAFDTASCMPVGAAGMCDVLTVVVSSDFRMGCHVSRFLPDWLPVVDTGASGDKRTYLSNSFNCFGRTAPMVSA